MLAVQAPRARELEIEWLGCVPYGDAVAIQERAVEERRAGVRGDRMLLLEHPPVVTLGRSAHPENLLATPAELASRGVDLFEARRGGDVTFHAPGQLVGYLIVDLGERRQQDVHRFLRDVEGGLIAALECLGLRTRRIDGMTGVFVADDGPPRKIASIGLGLRGWVTWHGFALNVSLDLAGFDSIVPCGLQGVEMTSVAQELDAAECGSALDLRARSAVGAAFSQLL